MRATILGGVLVALFAAATVAVGWWTLPALGFLFGLLFGEDASPGWVAGNAAGLSWAMLLAWTSTQGPVGSLARTVGAVMGLPGPALFAIAVVFAALCGGMGAVVGSGLRRAVTRPRESSA